MSLQDSQMDELTAKVSFNSLKVKASWNYSQEKIVKEKNQFILECSRMTTLLFLLWWLETGAYTLKNHNAFLHFKTFEENM